MQRPKEFIYSKEFVQSLAFAVSAVSAIASMIIFGWYYLQRDRTPPRIISTKLVRPKEYVNVDPNVLEAHLKRLMPNVERFAELALQHEETIRDIKDQLKLLTELDTTTDIGAKTALILTDVETLHARMRVIEEALLDNPEKALSIPLMQKDIEKIENAHRESVERFEGSQRELFDILRQNITQVDTQAKWFIRLMFTMIIGFAGLGVSIFVQIRKKA